MTVSTITETPAEALARIQSGFSKNDILVIHAFAGVGIEPERIDPRQNVLTFRAWKAAGRQVAKGAISIGVTVWIPCKGKKSADGSDGKKFMRPKLTRLFHIDQTIPAGAEKGTKPDAWEDEKMVREGTYEADAETVESWTESTTIEQVESEMMEKLTGQPTESKEFSGPTIGDIQPDCNCPMAGVMENVDCPIHGKGLQV